MHKQLLNIKKFKLKSIIPTSAASCEIMTKKILQTNMLMEHKLGISTALIHFMISCDSYLTDRCKGLCVSICIHNNFTYYRRSMHKQLLSAEKANQTSLFRHILAPLLAWHPDASHIMETDFLRGAVELKKATTK